MEQAQTLSTKIPLDLARLLDRTCRTLGLRKNHVVEEALREKVEEILDAHDLSESIRHATGFHSWAEVRRGLARSRKS